MAKVTYEGTRRRGDQSDYVVIDGVTLYAGVETEVSDELAKEIGSDSERLSGYKFSTGREQPKASATGEQNKER